MAGSGLSTLPKEPPARAIFFTLLQPARVGKESESAKDRDTGVYGGTPTQNSILQAYFSFGFLNHLPAWKVNEASLPFPDLSATPGSSICVSEEDGLGTSGLLLFLFLSFFSFFFRDMTETSSGQICNHFMNDSVQLFLVRGMLLSVPALTLIVEKDEADIFYLCVDTYVLEPRPLVLACGRRLSGVGCCRPVGVVERPSSGT